jgi:hypothetical protein
VNFYSWVHVMGRSVSSATLVNDQIDLYDPPGGIVRAVGVLPADVSVLVFSNNVYLPWTVLDGLTTPDSSISSGFVYFNEIPGSPGFYSVRFYPDRTGFWKLVYSVPTLPAEVIREFDVSPSGLSSSANGLNASFNP